MPMASIALYKLGRFLAWFISQPACTILGVHTPYLLKYIIGKRRA